ncbi:hypothetical protein [Streptomyces triticisoli]|uniref:hypothetical protein n=1 Tax=Streptomyces triticisoli TaxID=2182797 RepID=UPI000DD5D7BD|nr:hypothetical protein [Streptomyces triticisoli]
MSPNDPAGGTSLPGTGLPGTGDQRKSARARPAFPHRGEKLAQARGPGGIGLAGDVSRVRFNFVNGITSTASSGSRWR